MRQRLNHNAARFSDEQMEAIRQHFNETQQSAGGNLGSTDGRRKRSVRTLFQAWGRAIEQPFRSWDKETDLSSPDWRAVAATLVLGAGLIIIFGIYLLPHQ